MKQKLYRIITGVMLAAWMILIFLFSDQPATESSEVSRTVCDEIIIEVNQTFHLEMSDSQIALLADKIEYPIRKAAHMTEYAILGLLSFLFLAGFIKKDRRCFVLSWLIATVYAATDEFHQIFSAGRSAEVKDVFIDSAGTVIGLALLYFILKIKDKHCEKGEHPVK